jgi:peptide/nickel transport system substrate-binding protein
MRRIALTAVSAVLMLSAAACGSGSGSGSGKAATGGTLTLAPLVAAQPWDLADAGLGNNTQYYQPVYDSLLRLSPTAEVKPNLATKWSYDAARTVLTMTLRTGVKFTDGTALDAAAVKVNLLHTEKGTSEAAGQLKGITGVDVVNATTVAIKLSAPDPSLVPNLGNVAGMMASPKAIAAGTIKTTPVGSGPYTLDKSATTAGSTYTFVRNQGYWNKAAFPFDKIVLKPLTDPTAVLNALRSGQVNGALLASAKNVAPAKSSGLNVTKYTSGDVEGVYIWDREGKIVKALGDVRVRQALNYAFDRSTIVKTAKQGLGKATTQIFNPGGSAFDSSLDSKYSYDPAKAKQLLAEAGYPHGFSVTVPDVSSVFPDQQAAMVQQLEDIGIKVAKSALWNPLHSADPKVTDLITKAQSATGAAQDALFKQLNTYLVDQAWNAPWDSVENTYATTKGVTFTPQTFAAVPPIYNFKPTG